MHQRAQFSPFLRKGEPVRVPAAFARLFRINQLKQAIGPRGAAVDILDDSAQHPALRLERTCRQKYRLQLSFNEEVVDVDADILMAKGKVIGARICKAIFRSFLLEAGIIMASQKSRPTLLKESVEGGVVLNDCLKWPVTKRAL